MGKIIKWSSRIFWIVLGLRIFAPQSQIYQMIAPISEPIFEAILESLVQVINSDNTNNAVRELKNEKNKQVEIIEENPENQNYNNQGQVEDYSKVQEFDAIMPCQSRIGHVTHLHTWKSFNGKNFKAKFTILPKEACGSESFREQMPEPTFDGSIKDYYGKVYLQLIKECRPKMERIIRTYEKIGKKYQLNYRQFAEMVMTSIQEIPYVLVHPESCYKAKQWGGFMATYHAEGKECLPEIRFGLTSPTEFLYNLKGDCDTRTVFIYTILAHFGYDVAIFVSNTHCLLGIHLPNVYGDYLTYKGKKYFFWETTAKGFVPGVLPNEFRNDFWNIALVKP
ncbi:MAG: hypothetical protein NZ516_01810 [Raineya sp.]|nr:hypothetical protein [Raineya sp.]